MATAPKTEAKTEKVERKHPQFVMARERGYYGQLREPGEVFENTQDLPVFPGDEHSWLEAAKTPASE